MTHRSLLPPRVIPWSECHIVRYESNNGIVLMDLNDVVLFFIHGDDIGVTKDDLSEVPIDRARPILETMLEIHNTATARAYDRGYSSAKAEIRKVLGI